MIGASAGALHETLPFARTSVDFAHLIVPLREVADGAALMPDFGAIEALSHDIEVDTVVAFALHGKPHPNTLRCRDFCPAVGTPESAGAGTTNRALSTYLLAHGALSASDDGVCTVRAEQGYEMHRPALVCSSLNFEGGHLATVDVGGVATCVARGELYV